MTAVAERLVITEPGVYDIPEADYHADPVPGGSLSSSGARKLLPPSCPALYRWERDHPEPKRHFEYGTAAHRMVLGLGAEWVLLDYPDYRTKAAQQARDEARAAGAAPILSPELEQITAMAGAIREHPLAGPLLCREDVQPEQSLFWQDDGVWRRARLDAIRRGGRLLISDYKTARSAEPGQFARSAASYGYHQQAAWYLDAVLAVLGELDAAFLFVVQEKEPPYLVTVCEMDGPSLEAGRARNRQAIERYRDCTEAGMWPGYSTDIELISLPSWATRTEEYL